MKKENPQKLAMKKENPQILAMKKGSKAKNGDVISRALILLPAAIFCPR